MDLKNSVRYTSIPIGDLKPSADHARQHGRHQRRKIRRLLEQLGTQPVPIMCTPDNVIIDGHALCEVMREMGATEVLVAIVQNQSVGQKKARLSP